MDDGRTPKQAISWEMSATSRGPGWKKIKKNTKKFEVEKLVRVVLRGKTVVQQYGVKSLNGNRNALK